MLEESNLILLSREELLGIQLSDYLPPQQDSLLKIVVNFNLHNKDNFLKFYRKELNDFQENEDNLLNKIRVNKSRLNNSLKDYDLYIDKIYKIYRINTMSLEFINSELSKLVKNQIETIKIYDAYTGDDKKLFLSDYLKITLKKMIDFGRNIEIISILNNNHTREFYKELLNYQYLKNKNVLQIKYIRNTFVQSSSLFYVLINDVENIDYIIYWEKITKWSVLTKVSPETTFSEKFFKLLNDRFNYYFLDINKELSQRNEIVNVTIDTFKNDFLYETNKLIDNLKKSISFNEQSKDASKRLFYNLVKNAKEIQISFPEEKDSIMILLHFIKLAEISLKFRFLEELPITGNLITQIINSKVHINIYRQLHNEIKIKNNNYLISKPIIQKILLQKLRHLLNSKNLFSINNEKIFIIDLFPNHRWNTYEQISDSLNLIIESPAETKQILIFFINNENKNILEDKITKILLRVIFYILYEIPFEEQLNNTDKEKLLYINYLSYDKELKNKIAELSNKK